MDMLEPGLRGNKANIWENTTTYSSVLNLPSQCTEEFISEETRPSLYSLSLSDSVCSDATIDLEVLDETLVTGTTNSNPNLSTASNKVIADDTERCTELKKICDRKEISKSQKGLLIGETCNDFGTFRKKFRKCFSLHDVSNILPLPLTSKVNTASCETIHSHSLSSTSKSKDSGFQRSVSCLSLNSGNRSYDHVQSKVKAYIRNIKESEALRKRNNLLAKGKLTCEPEKKAELDRSLQPEDLLLTINQLKNELHEKSHFIDVQQRNYNNLLLKLAEAKNTIDTLRLQRLSSNYYRPSLNSSHNFSSRDFNINLSDLSHNKCRNESDSSVDSESVVASPVKLDASVKTPSTSVTEYFLPNTHSTPDPNTNKRTLSPVCKLFSSSFRLHEPYKLLQSLNKNEDKSNGTSVNSIKIISDAYCCVTKKPTSQNSTNPVINTAKTTLCKQSSSSFYNACQNENHIDLPKDDPFDKVKKWQASLPSIHLLGSQSSSECDPTDKPTLKTQSFKKCAKKNLLQQVKSCKDSVNSEQDLSRASDKQWTKSSELLQTYKERFGEIMHTNPLNNDLDVNLALSHQFARCKIRDIEDKKVERQQSLKQNVSGAGDKNSISAEQLSIHSVFTDRFKPTACFNFKTNEQPHLKTNTETVNRKSDSCLEWPVTDEGNFHPFSDSTNQSWKHTVSTNLLKSHCITNSEKLRNSPHLKMSDTKNVLFERERVDALGLNSGNSSLCDSGSVSCVPQCSSLSCTQEKCSTLIFSSSCSNEESSSISSSVLESNQDPLLTVTNQCITKRSSKRTIPHEAAFPCKVIRLGKDEGIKKSCRSRLPTSKFILREPKLNYTIPFGTGNENKNKMRMCTINRSEPLSKFCNNLNSVMDNSPLNQSSQKESWKSGVNNFQVVEQKHHYKTSSSLQECLNEVEQMVNTGSSLLREIEFVLERSLASSQT